MLEIFYKGYWWECCNILGDNSGYEWKIWSWELSSELPCSIVQIQLMKVKDYATEFICNCHVASAQGLQLSPDGGKLLQSQQWDLIWCHIVQKQWGQLKFYKPWVYFPVIEVQWNNTMKSYLLFHMETWFSFLLLWLFSIHLHTRYS